MGRKKLITLAKELDFETEEQYFEYCIDSYINGQPQQCEQLFKAMRGQDKQNLIVYMIASETPNEIYKFYLTLLLNNMSIKF